MNFRALINLYSARRNLRLKPSERERMQNKKLRKTISHAYRNVPFYHRKFRSNGIKPDDIKSVEDLVRIPITTKSEIQMTPLNEMVAKNVDVTACVNNKTSGSTGMPLLTLEDKKSVNFTSAVWLRFYFENGIRFWDKIAVIRSPINFPKRRSWSQRFRLMQRKHISAFDDLEKQLAILRDYNPDVLESYPSSLALLADIYKKSGDGLKPRLIFTFAELSDKGTRDLISSAFEAELFDYYGSSELNLVAWECRGHMGYHMNVDTLVLEFIKDGERVASGERGEIVGTTLINNVMPLIRYNVGDVGVPVEEECSCGITLPLMKTVEGRSNDFLIATDGRIISPMIFTPSYLFGSYEGIKQFRIIQESRDKLTIQLAVWESFLKDPQVLERAERAIQKLFGASMQVEFQILEKIDRDPTGKLRLVISRVPVQIGATSFE